MTRLVVKRVVVKPGLPGGKLYKGRRFNPDSVIIEYTVLDAMTIAALCALMSDDKRAQNTRESGRLQVAA